MSALISLVGIAVLFTVAFLSSTNRRQINWRTVSLALLLQFTLGGIVLYLPIGVSLLSAISDAVTSVLGNAQDGIAFVFGPIGAFEMGFIFAFHVLPVIVFFSALVSVLYYLGIMGWIIRVIGGALQKLLGTSKAESMSATANIFVGQTEAPLVVKPYIPNMTRSELFAVMVGGMATVAGSVLAGYVLLGVELRYLLAASFMAAPGGFLMAKMMIPETEEIVEDSEEIELKFDEHVNVIDAAAAGASSGMALALNVGAMVLAFVGLIALINAILAWAGGLVGFESLSLQLMLGYAFQPLAFLLGIPWEGLGPLLSWHHGLDHSRYWRRLAKVTRHEQSGIDVGDGEYFRRSNRGSLSSEAVHSEYDALRTFRRYGWRHGNGSRLGVSGLCAAWRRTSLSARRELYGCARRLPHGEDDDS